MSALRRIPDDSRPARGNAAGASGRGAKSSPGSASSPPPRGAGAVSPSSTCRSSACHRQRIKEAKAVRRNTSGKLKWLSASSCPRGTPNNSSKAEKRPSSEIRRPKPNTESGSDLFRPSFGLRPSAFGFDPRVRHPIFSVAFLSLSERARVRVRWQSSEQIPGVVLAPCLSRLIASSVAVNASGTPPGWANIKQAFRWSPPLSPNDHRLPSANPAGWLPFQSAECPKSSTGLEPALCQGLANAPDATAATKGTTSARRVGGGPPTTSRATRLSGRTPYTPHPSGRARSSG